MSCKNWNNSDKGNVNQDNNATENIITKMVNDLGKIPAKSIYRETCGPSSLESCLEGLGIDQGIAGILQPSDYYTMAMNDGKIINNKYFDKPTNRYLEAYPLIIGILYHDIKARVIKIDGLGQDRIAELLGDALKAPDTTCIINLKNPGHYVAGLHMDDSGIVTYNDSWLEDYFNPAKTHKRTIKLADLVANMKNGFVKIWL